jgi:hypothetical protein
MSTTPQRDLLKDNLSVLAHAVELSTKIVLRVAGKDAADTVAGAQITEASVADAAAARIQAHLAPYVGA